MDEDAFRRWKTLAFFASLAAVLLFERVARWKRFPKERGSGALRNVSLAVFDAGFLAVVCAGCSCAAARWAAKAGIGLFNVLDAPIWLAIATTGVAFDLLSYGWHRANHRVASLWRFHAVHHSDPVFDATTSFRFHPGELALSLPVRLALVLLLGPPVAAILVFETVFAFFNLLVHGNIRLPARLEAAAGSIFIHPALHRMHHSQVGEESNRNFGTILSLWDRAFGTLRPSTSTHAIGIGLSDVPGPSVANVASQLALPLRPIRPAESRVR